MQAIANFSVIHILAPLIVFIMEKLMGWDIAEPHEEITEPKFIFLTEHHTSNWDVMAMFFWAAKHRRRVFYVIKDDWQRNPIIGNVLKWSGAIFINRDAPLSALKTIIKETRKHEQLMLLIAPSGTRKYAEGWKPGFYYIAQKTHIPILPAAPDYGTKTVKIGEMFYPTGDIEADIETLRPFYENTTPKHPERAVPIRLLPQPEKEAAVIV